MPTTLSSFVDEDSLSGCELSTFASTSVPNSKALCVLRASTSSSTWGSTTSVTVVVSAISSGGSTFNESNDGRISFPGGWFWRVGGGTSIYAERIILNRSQCSQKLSHYSSFTDYFFVSFMSEPFNLNKLTNQLENSFVLRLHFQADPHVNKHKHVGKYSFGGKIWVNKSMRHDHLRKFTKHHQTELHPIREWKQQGLNKTIQEQNNKTVQYLQNNKLNK